MAESIPEQSATEKTVFETAPASLKDAPSEVVAVEKAEPLHTNGVTPVPEAAPIQDALVAAPVKDNATQVTTEETLNGTSAPTQDKSTAAQPAPVQTTTGEPNGTNGVSVNGTSATTEDDTEIPLFSPTLISPEVSAILPEGYTMRPLRRSDYNRGFLDTLRVLTTVGSPSFSTFSDHFALMASIPSTYHILVILDSSDQIVGTGAVIVERKFIHNMGLVGHIEDIAVAKNQQGKKLGLRIIQALDYVAEKVGCYKCILDCSEANEGFYVKCGFKRAGLEMAHYYGRD
ncbi:uncharacterized protein HMPREF1541_05013 [Cyphellophora europaea CBS 101466]|uniref:Glucosamine 6-phosphate N-acetyltransferase n=1 Tax=Cyphellophora europaea (strain CBS 101466) TaxID=1220924 RepID=W2RY63_CYPE1|nr:uncharacterized protein HMPREF1541_05013 [Cyphellophora europaea CBS 101466]ETN40733.1 hypothetical protein HMPREF1541_05013 [Cyphellophora europaea CBS 101466]